MGGLGRAGPSVGVMVMMTTATWFRWCRRLLGRGVVCFGGVGLYLESEGPDDDGDEVGGERDGD